MTIDIRRIEYFLAVVQHENISSAAEALRVSQPTLSRQIHSLEQQFSAPLFIRHGRGVMLTEAGKRLLEGVRGLEHQLRDLKDEVAAAAREPRGKVVLGIPPSPRTLLGISIIHAFCTAYPKVLVEICERTSGDIRDLLARGEIDLAIVNSDEPMHGLVTDRLATEPMLLIGPRDANLSLTVETPISRLAELPLILTTDPNSLRRMVAVELNRKGLVPKVRVEADTLPLMTDLVTRGLGYTVLPSCGIHSLVAAGQFSASPIKGLRITWTVARPQNRNLSIAARLMLATILRVVYDAVESGSWAMAKIERDCTRAVIKKTNVLDR